MEGWGEVGWEGCGGEVGEGKCEVGWAGEVIERKCGVGCGRVSIYFGVE